MATVRYTMVDPGAGPPGRAGAMMPTPAIMPKASTGGLVHVAGAPGNLAVPAPKPCAIPPNAAVRTTQPSYVSPDVMFPSKYVASAAHMHPPVNLQRYNELPVPAVSPYALPGIAQRMRRVGGQSQVRQPLALQTWPQWRGQGGN